MLLMIDANIMVQRPLLTGTKWDAIGLAVHDEYIEFAISALAIDEAVARFQFEHQRKAKELRTLIKRSSPEMRQILESGLDRLHFEAESYEGALRERLAELGADIQDFPSAGHEAVSQRAIQRIPPFDSEGNGYRDTLHWLALLERMEETEHQDAVFVSADRKAFGDRALGALYAEALERHSSTLQIIYDIEALEIPNEFTSEEPDFFQYLEESQLERAVDRAFRDDDISSFLDAEDEADTARIIKFGAGEVEVVQVREDYRSRELLVFFVITYNAVVELEKAQIDEDEIDYVVYRDEQLWTVRYRGTATSTNHKSEIGDVTDLALIEADYVGYAVPDPWP